MVNYLDFKPSNISFTSRMGAPRVFDAAMGLIALNFSDLEDTARYVILFLLGAGLKTGYIMTAPLSFRQKLDVLMSLVLGHAAAPPVEEVRELFQLCQRAEELRNGYLHSSYHTRERFKVSARARDGIRVHREWVDAGLLLDVADYIAYAAGELEGVPFMLDLADEITGNRRGIEYRKKGSVVAKFNFGEIA